MILSPLPPLNPKHVEERLKLAASGLQARALTLFGTVILAPFFSNAIPLTSSSEKAMNLPSTDRQQLHRFERRRRTAAAALSSR